MVLDSVKQILHYHQIILMNCNFKQVVAKNVLLFTDTFCTVYSDNESEL